MINDEKVFIINMVVDGIITSSEGEELLHALCDIEDIDSCKVGVETENPRHLPPWASNDNGLFNMLFNNECAKAISTANQEIISAFQKDKLENLSSGISALDAIHLSGFRLRPKEKGNGGYTRLSRINMKLEDRILRIPNWNMSISCWINWTHTDLELSPGWWEPMLMQAFGANKSLQVEWGAEEVVNDEAERIKLTSSIESFDDSVTTKAGEFNNCIKLKTIISNSEDYNPEEIQKFSMDDNLRMLGTKFIWFAPGVGIVKFLYKHFNNTQTDVELVDYHVRGDEPLYFPLSSGNYWQYQWEDELVVHRELWRVILRDENENYILCCVKPMIEID